MHELALTQSIVDLVVDCARREHITRVSRVLVEIGIGAPVEPQALLFCFPVVAEETVAAGGELVINRVALRAQCKTCQTEYAPKNLISPCPTCGSFARHILAGLEMRVLSFNGE